MFLGLLLLLLLLLLEESSLFCHRPLLAASEKRNEKKNKTRGKDQKKSMKNNKNERGGGGGRGGNDLRASGLSLSLSFSSWSRLYDMFLGHFLREPPAPPAARNETNPTTALAFASRAFPASFFFSSPNVSARQANCRGSAFSNRHPSGR